MAAIWRGVYEALLPSKSCLRWIGKWARSFGKKKSVSIFIGIGRTTNEGREGQVVGDDTSDFNCSMGLESSVIPFGWLDRESINGCDCLKKISIKYLRIIQTFRDWSNGLNRDNMTLLSRRITADLDPLRLEERNRHRRKKIWGYYSH
jgi:hypothetical protein